MRPFRPERRATRLGAATAAIALAVAALAQAAAADCTESVRSVFEKVSPSTVLISVVAVESNSNDEVFVHAYGSGFIYETSGTRARILTNAHVVWKAQIENVTLDSGERLPARTVGIDPIYDIAVLEIEIPDGAKGPEIPLGSSADLRTGEPVIAIGNPLGLDQTVTHGVVSGIGRELSEAPLSIFRPMIQTDAAINPGNSGGPLVNLCGEVVGINSANIPSAQSIGFAIPIDLVKDALPQLVKSGRIVRPWLGFYGKLIDRRFVELFRLPLAPGLLIASTDPGGPAEKAGLRGGKFDVAVAGDTYLLGGDIVTRINGEALDSPETLERVMKRLLPGQTVALDLLRDGEPKHVEYELPERPYLPGDSPN